LKYWFIPSLMCLLAGRLPAATPAKHIPVIVELFTAEGCSSCPPADQLLAQLEKFQPVPEADIIVLGEHVDYWNELGWQDRFSAHLYTIRQQDYASAFAVENVYTPQMVVNGQAEFNGADMSRALQEIRRAATGSHATVSLRAKNVSTLLLTVNQFPAGTKNAEILLAITEGSLTSDVRRGENFGRKLTHTGVVRSLVSIANIDTRKTPEFTSDVPFHLRPDWNRANLHAVILVADRRTHRIVGATKFKL
jgi:hypothetical protein